MFALMMPLFVPVFLSTASRIIPPVVLEIAGWIPTVAAANVLRASFAEGLAWTELVIPFLVPVAAAGALFALTALRLRAGSR